MGGQSPQTNGKGYKGVQAWGNQRGGTQSLTAVDTRELRMQGGSPTPSGSPSTTQALAGQGRKRGGPQCQTSAVGSIYDKPKRAGGQQATTSTCKCKASARELQSTVGRRAPLAAQSAGGIAGHGSWCVASRDQGRIRGPMHTLAPNSAGALTRKPTFFVAC